MLLEMHVHTSAHSSCSSLNPVTLIKQTVLKGLQGVIITDHHYLWSETELAELKKRAEVNENFIILSGQEVETDIGHVLVYGAERSIKDKISLSRLREKYPDSALVWAHPFRNGSMPSKGMFFNPIIDAIEIFSSNHTQKENYYGLKFWHDYKFTAVCGSDAHNTERIGILPAQFDHPVSNITEVIIEIKAGRVRPFFKEIPKSGSHLTVTEVTFGTKGDDENRNRIIIKKASNDNAWEKEMLSVKINKAIHSKGFDSKNKLRVPEIIDASSSDKILIEEGQRGKNLFELLLNVKPEIGIEYFKLSAKWLAKLHNAKLKITSIEDTLIKEEKRFNSYLKAFKDTKSPYIRKASELIDFVKKWEEKLFSEKNQEFIQIHGDFHPKNIIIGYDRLHDPSTMFISVIDFNNSILMPGAFDAGYFLAQFNAQFSAHPEILKNYTHLIFTETYLNELSHKPDDITRLMEFFKTRGRLSIAAFYVKVGKGESPEMAELMAGYI
jgi:hypothetical protein